MKDQPTVEDFRKSIDDFDEHIALLLHERFAVAMALALTRELNGGPKEDKKREEEVIQNVKSCVKNDAQAKALEEIYRTVIKCTKELQSNAIEKFHEIAYNFDDFEEATKLLREIFDFNSLNEDSASSSINSSLHVGLLGYGVLNSLSPQVHEHFGLSKYSIYDKKPNKLDEFLAEPYVNAFNVTSPFKQDVFERCDVLDEISQATRSVNLAIHGDDGKLYGYNMDMPAFAGMLAYFDVDIAGKKALILGTGGAARSVNYALEKMGIGSCYYVSRTPSNDAEVSYLEAQAKHHDAQIIINATPVGRVKEYPSDWGIDDDEEDIDEVAEALNELSEEDYLAEAYKSPLDLTCFNQLECAIDLNYSSLCSPFMQQAEAKGAKAINGLYMLIDQARFSDIILLDTDIPESESGVLYNKLASSMTNIVLVGMPGSGKTTIAKKLASELRREFIDIDKDIEEITGLTPARFIRENGEEEFRAIEAEVLQAVLARQEGIVVATGGGSVLDKKNRTAIRLNSRVYFIDTPLNILATKDRPLSGAVTSEKMKEMEKVRRPLYEEVADATIVNTATVGKAVKRIKGEFDAHFGA